MVKPSYLLRIFITLFFIGGLYFILRGEIPQVRAALLGVKPLFLTVTVLCQILVVVLTSVRLRWFFEAYGLRFSLKETTSLSFIGLFFNNFLPTATGGDLAKAYYVYKRARRKLDSFASVVADRIIGLFSLVSMALFGLLLLWNRETFSIKMTVGILFLFGCLCISVLFNRRVAKGVQFLVYPLERLGLRGRMKGVYDALNRLNQKQSLLWKAVGFSIVIHTFVICSLFILLKGLSLEVPIFYLFLVFPLISASSMLPSLNGLGVREGAFIYFLGGTVGKGNAAALSIVWLGILTFLSLIGGVLCLVRGGSVSLKQIQEVNS